VAEPGIPAWEKQVTYEDVAAGLDQAAARIGKLPYDPARDLAIVLTGALRQGFHSPGVVIALRRLREELGLHAEHPFVSDVEAAVRAALAPAARRQAALANVAYLASLTDEQLHEALIFFKYEQPDKAARLRALLLGDDASST
jgi:hypothetical protein